MWRFIWNCIQIKNKGWASGSNEDCQKSCPRDDGARDGNIPEGSHDYVKDEAS